MSEIGSGHRTFSLRIFKAEDTFYSGEAEFVAIPGIDGEYGVQAFHENVVVPIVPGMMKYQVPGGEMLYASVSSGMMRIEDNDVLILVESAERPEEIDEARAREEAAAAREAMLQKQSAQEYYLAEATLRRAVNRIRVKKGFQ